ncbi:hypothetical protein [Pseudoxanthomonas mexicana]|uniref:hypothetical protein n=1 Tax=Pseudoxanthomonas mexicana TaxID=128785 RepID=UPI00398B3DC9
MKRLMILPALCLAFAATAQPPADTSGDAAASQPVAASEAARADHAKDAKRLDDRQCLRETGTRIVRRDARGACGAQPGRAYTREDIQRTGHTDLVQALRALDPAIR